MPNIPSNRYFRKRHKLLIALLMLWIWFWYSLPQPLFPDDHSTVLLDEQGKLLSARIADDEQWRFPMPDSLPGKYVIALITYEDRNFFSHHGVYAPSLLKAFWENIKAGRIVRGGSTITMQVIRMSRKNPPRNILQKATEMVLAIRLSLTHTKEEILTYYSAHAPFGSNVVGIGAASWRYYGKHPHQLSWAEAATLAVLPNNPALIYPGRNTGRLMRKRNRLLDILHDQGIINDETCMLAKAEPPPERPLPLPDMAPHLLQRLVKEGHGSTIAHTTINYSLQQQVTAIAGRHHAKLSGTGIHNLAVLILDTRTGAVKAYIGNAPGTGKSHQQAVDIIAAPRSTGSIMKPLLYAMMLDDGLLFPNTLVKDIPTQYGSFRPMNYHKSYSGAVPASKALARSLNVPTIRMLRQYGIAKFSDKLTQMGITTLNKPASHYGLSIILGGAEGNLWDLCGLYGSLGRSLLHFTENNSRYDPNDFHPPVVLQETLPEYSSPSWQVSPPHLHAASIYLTFKAMIEVVRPDEESNWQYFSSMVPVAWKTGTSYGNRDAWAIGVNPNYVVGVWAGNANGEGRPSLTGISAAAPLLFDIFSRLNSTRWFDVPYDDMVAMPVCRYSGYPATDICEHIDTILVPLVNHSIPPCPYHRLIHLDKSGTYRVNNDCVNSMDMTHKPWFVLPPVVEHYFKAGNPFYKSLPPWHPNCKPTQQNVMEIIYPGNLSEIFIPIDFGGRRSNVIFEVAHNDPHAKIFWYIDKYFIGTTKGTHKKGVMPASGWHRLTLTDDKGNSVSRRFCILDRTE